MIHHDGKVIEKMYKAAPGDTRKVKVVDADTGEETIELRPVRADPDAKVHITGDDRQVHGSKFWHAEVRGDDVYSRVFLTVDYVPSEKDGKNSEADVAMKNLLALAPRVPGALGAMCDTVLRGVHINELVRETGWVIMNPVAAKSVDKKTKERTEKEYYLRTESFEHDGRRESVEIWTVGGRLARIVHTEDGTRVPVPLERHRTFSRQNKNGERRAYVEYEVPDPLGGEPRIIRERILQHADDTFNRPENVRQIAPG